MFLVSGTQWRFAGMDGVPAGLDYAGVRAAAEALGVAWGRALLDGLRIMEGAAVRRLIAVRRRQRDSAERGRA